MGHDILLIEDGVVLLSAIRVCSGNWDDLWEKYGVGPYVFEGHRCDVIARIIETRVAQILGDWPELETLEGIGNSNYLWGLDSAENQLPEKERVGAFLRVLEIWLGYVQEFPNAQWHSDQVHFTQTLDLKDYPELAEFSGGKNIEVDKEWEKTLEKFYEAEVEAEYDCY